MNSQATNHKDNQQNPSGYLAILLHAHLPFVRHPEHPSFLEEDWLFEAITETYVPLLDVFNRLRQDDVDFRITMSITPTLCEMLADPLLQGRYASRLTHLREFCSRELARTEKKPELHRTARMYAAKLARIAKLYEEDFDRDLISQFRRLQDAGNLEIITCAATHGFLPLFSHPACIRAQLKGAMNNYERHFGRPPQGVWLPECGYSEGLDNELARVGLRFFFLDSHGILFGHPRPKYGIFAPVLCRSRVAVFGRDIESSRQVWSSTCGYPGDPAYREFYRDMGYDADETSLGPLMPEDGKRRNIGIKYHRVTGEDIPLHEKALYDPSAALSRAEAHAENFLSNRRQQAAFLLECLEKPPLIVSPYDAELFGHWWYEGPEFLHYLLHKLAKEQNEIRMVTPGEYLQSQKSLQVIQPSASSWGDKGYFEVWLNGQNDWIYRHLHEAEERMVSMAHANRNATGPLERALNQAARELMLAQSSDWAFIMTTGTMVDYAVRRTREHIERFQRLHAMIDSGAIDENSLAEIERRDNLFPEMDFRLYCE